MTSYNGLYSQLGDHKAIENGPVSQVLARPPSLKIKKQNSIFQKASNKQKY